MPETIETLSGLHTMRALTLAQLSALIRAAFPSEIACAMLGISTPQNGTETAGRARGGQETQNPPPSDVSPLRAQNVNAEGRGAKLRALADTMQREIDAKRNPATASQRPTRRRMAIVESMRSDAERLEQVQTALYALAEALNTGAAISPFLTKWQTKTGIHGLLFGGHGTNGPGKFYADELRELMANYHPVQDETKKAEELRRGLRERERRAAMEGIPGYFPTPPALSERLVRGADIKPGMSVLEPSAGAGHLADEIKRQTPDCRLSCVEINWTLSQILSAKGHGNSRDNFIDGMKAEDRDELFDRVVMNPPFELGQDIDHIRHAYTLLRPGGVLAAILCEGPFFRDDRKSTNFRAWLDGDAAPFTDAPFVMVNEQNPPGSFQTSDRPTGVATRTLILRKPLS